MTPKELADRVEAAMLVTLSDAGVEDAEVAFSQTLPDSKVIATASTPAGARHCAMIDLVTGKLSSTQIAQFTWEEIQSELEVGSELKWIGNSKDGDFALYFHDQLLKSKML